MWMSGVVVNSVGRPQCALAADCSLFCLFTAAHIEPIDPLCEKKFGYDGNGGIWPAAIGGNRAKNMIQKLNLNDQSLQYERLSIVIEIEERINDGTIDAANQAAEVTLWRTVDANGQLISYGHGAARYLEEQAI